jgi:hypothetical protein
MFDIKNCFTAVLTTNVLKQAITASAASVNYIDQNKANIKLGAEPRKTYLVVRVIDAFTSGGASTGLTVALETDTDAGFATALKQVLKETIALASLTAGKVILCIPLPVQKYQQFMRAYFTAEGGNFGAGSVVAYLSDTPEDPESQLDVV